MSIAIAYIAFILIGAVSGVLAGLLGIGGGVVTVPCLLVVFTLLGYLQPFVMQMAIATSLAAMIFNMAVATWEHNKRKAVLWDVWKRMAPGIVIGSLVGAVLGIWLSGVLLEIFFGIFLLLLAFYFYRRKAILSGIYKLPSVGKLSLYSGCVGVVSTLLGIGGGSMTVPLLSAFKISDKNAIGTSVAATLLTALTGTIIYLVFGWNATPSPDNIGLINLPAFLVIGLTSMLTAPYGVRLSHELPPQKVRKIFAIVLALTGLSLIFL